MKALVEFTEQEYLQFNTWYWKRKFPIHLLGRRQIWLICILLALFYLYGLLTGMPWIVQGVFLGFILLLSGLTLWFSHIWRKWYIGRAYKDIQDQARAEIELTENAIIEVGTSHEARWSWHAVEGLFHSSGVSYLMVSGMQALILPRRCFESEAAYKAFLDYAADHLRRAGKEVLPI